MVIGTALGNILPTLDFRFEALGKTKQPVTKLSLHRKFKLKKKFISLTVGFNGFYFNNISRCLSFLKKMLGKLSGIVVALDSLSNGIISNWIKVGWINKQNLKKKCL